MAICGHLMSFGCHGLCRYGELEYTHWPTKAWAKVCMSFVREQHRRWLLLKERKLGNIPISVKALKMRALSACSKLSATTPLD